ncbi:MAG: hypothetical protein WBE37_17590 [Bryobacteraceae bacterium]
MIVRIATAVTIVLVGSLASAQQIQVRDFTEDGSATVKDPDAPVSLELPQGWSLFSGHRWGDHETTLQLADAESGTRVALYYQYPLQKTFQDARAALHQWIDMKVRQRRGEGLTDYHVQPGSVHDLMVGGHPAESFVGEFTAAGQPENEFILRVLGQTTKAHFFLKMPPGTDFAALLKRLAPLMVTLNIQ